MEKLLPMLVQWCVIAGGPFPFQGAQVSIRRLKEVHDLAHPARLERTRTGEAVTEDVDEKAVLLATLDAEGEEEDSDQ